VSEQSQESAPFIAYAVPGRALEIRPAPFERDWMDASDQRFAYRCLPLNIANAYGWELLTPSGFTAGWTGGDGLDAILIAGDAGTDAPVVSVFGRGGLTFHINFLFRTPPGYDLFVTGPINRPKDGISPLSGIVETDWAPFTFTMNWQFTRPNMLLRFEAGEPFCHIFPVRRGEIETMAPEIRDLASDPELEARFQAWSSSRVTFNRDLKVEGSEAHAAKWQKHYYRGQDVAGAATDADHRTKVRVKPFERK
jgi:hypothetical protein